MTPDVEEWRPIVGYEGCYEISDYGQVRSVDRFVRGPYGEKPWRLRGKPMKPTPWRKGYLGINLNKLGKQRRLPVHRLVLEAFIGPCPEGLQACHNNNVKTDNRLANLRWDTPSANILDQVSAGVHNQARKTHCPQGHDYDAKNTYVGKNGGRSCRLCARDRARAAKAAKKAA